MTKPIPRDLAQQAADLYLDGISIAAIADTLHISERHALRLVRQGYPIRRPFRRLVHV